MAIAGAAGLNQSHKIEIESVFEAPKHIPGSENRVTVGYEVSLSIPDLGVNGVLVDARELPLYMRNALVAWASEIVEQDLGWSQDQLTTYLGFKSVLACSV